MNLIKKYSKGTPKPFAVMVKRTASTEKKAASLLLASGDKKGVAEKVGEVFVIHHRRWFDTHEQAQEFVTSHQEKMAKVEEKKPEEGKKVVATVKAPAKDTSVLKSDLTKMSTLMAQRGNKDLSEKTKKVLTLLG